MAETNDKIVKAIKLAKEVGLRVDGYYTVTYDRIISTDEACERFDWLRDEARLGYFDYAVSWNGLTNQHDQTVYYFTNEQTAFEFKMRWR